MLGEENQRSRKRVHSASSHSSLSVSTISTTVSRSRSRSGSLRRDFDEEDMHSIRGRSSPRQSMHHKRRYSESSSNYSQSPNSSRPANSNRIGESGTERHTRRRRRESSPNERGRKRASSIRHQTIDTSDSCEDRDSLRVERKDESKSSAPRNNHLHGRRQHSGGIFSSSRQSSHNVDRDHPNSDLRISAHRTAPGPAQRKRSLSPFSKRLALTQAMNMSR